MHGEASDRADGSTPVDLLADLQAGLLADDAAAALRRRARTDPEVARRLAALDRVRRDVAGLGVDADSAPAVPADVTERIAAALRHQPPPGPAAGRWRSVAAWAGVAAAVAAVGVGTTMLVHHEPPAASAADPSSVTAPRPAGGVPLSDGQLLAMLDQPPDLGTLAAPQRRASCLSGLGYPASTEPLGARPLEILGRPGVLLLLPGDAPKRVTAVVVGPTCSAADTGLLASRVLTRP